MPSGIDPTKPVTGQPASKAELRANLQMAKTELDHGGFFTQSAAGAVERQTHAKLRELHLSVADFGAVGDGATDNNAALIAMRDWMRRDTSRLYRIFFPPGHYIYTNNRWLFGVPRVIVDGYGAKVQPILDAGFDENSRPLNCRDPFNTSGDVPTSGANTHDTGFRFYTAAAGDKTITLTTTGDVLNFSAGIRVLLHGYDQQFSGYPPNPRYFEYKVIESVDTENDTITFTEPLDYAYDDRWPDGGLDNYFAGGALPWGKPRILSLERPDYLHAKFVWIRGLEFVESPHAEPGQPLSLQIPGDLVILEDVTCTYLAPSMSKTVMIRRCHITHSFELDKVIDTALVENCVAHHLGGASGVNRLTVRNSQLREGQVRPRPRFASFESCDIWPPFDWQFGAILHPGGFPVEVLRVEGVRAHDPAGSLLHLVNDGVDQTLTVDDVDGNAILLTWDEHAQDAAVQLMHGTLLTNADETKSGRITAIYHDGGDPGNLVIEGNWASAPVAAEVWKWRPIQRCVDGGGNHVVGRWDVPLFRRG